MGYNRFTLAGYVGGPAGNERRLSSAAVVVRKDDEYFASPGLSHWNTRSLVKVNPQDHGLITWLEGRRNMLPVEEGMFLWVAGHEWYHKATKLPDVIANFGLRYPDPNFGFQSWETMDNLTFYRLGTLREFEEFGTRLANFWARVLHNALVGPQGFLSVSADVFEIYQGIPVKDDVERSVNLGLYFYETRDSYSYDFQRMVAVTGKIFRSPKSFDQAVEKRHNWLALPRLSDPIPQTVE